MFSMESCILHYILQKHKNLSVGLNLLPLFLLIFQHSYHMKQYEKAGNAYDRYSDKLVKC